MPASREAKIGLAAVGAVVAARVVLGNFVVNEWEGWGTFVPTAVGALVEGLVLGGLVFGLLVRLAARARGGRPAVAALATGVLGVLSLAIPYSAPQAIVGAGAVALGLSGRERAPALGRAAIVLGLLVIAVWVAFMVFTVVTGDWPIGSD